MTELNQGVIDLINSGSSVKLLATVDGDGIPHVECNDFLQVVGDKLHYLDFNEGSITSRNLTRSIWYDRLLAIVIRGQNGNTFQIKGKAIKNIVSGPLFQEHYVRVRNRFGDIDLCGIWVIKPEEVIDHGLRECPYIESNPTFVHLDRIAR